MPKNITIYDLAKELKLDSSTISRALGSSARVGEATRKRVLLKAKEMGYQRNLMASNLRNNKTMTIGIVVPFISRHFFSEAIDGIEQIVSKNGFQVIISQTYDSVETEKKVLKNLFMNRVDGLIISPSIESSTGNHLNIFNNNNIPVVLFDRYFEKGNLNKVIFEDKKGAFDLTQHVIDNNCKRIYHLAGNLNTEIYKQRLKGYKEALQKNDIYFDDSFVKISNLNAQESTEIIKELLKDMENFPDGLICSNDISALSIMKYLEENTNIKVPEDICIAGFSNERASKFIKPSLTTLDQQPFKIGATAAKMLLDFIDDKGSYDQNNTIIIKSSIIKRGSTSRS